MRETLAYWVVVVMCVMCAIGPPRANVSSEQQRGIDHAVLRIFVRVERASINVRGG